MSEAAVADRTATAASTQTAAENAAPKDSAAQAPPKDDAAQSQADGGQTTQPGDEVAKGEQKAPSPVDIAVAEGQKAVIAEMAEMYGLEGDYASMAELRAAIQEQSTAEQEAELETTSKSYYADLGKKLNDTLVGLEIDAHDEDGRPIKVALAKEQIQKAFGPLNEFRTRVREIEQDANLVELADSALELIPESQHAAFTKAVEGKDLPLHEWQQQVLEHAVTTTKAWKDREREFGVQLAKEKAEAWTEGHEAPAGQPSANAANGGNGVSAGGKLNAAQWNSMTKDQQAQAWKERPAEVRAL